MIAIKRELANSQFSSDAEMQSVLVWRKSELEKNVNILIQNKIVGTPILKLALVKRFVHTIG